MLTNTIIIAVVSSPKEGEAGRSSARRREGGRPIEEAPPPPPLERTNAAWRGVASSHSRCAVGGLWSSAVKALRASSANYIQQRNTWLAGHGRKQPANQQRPLLLRAAVILFGMYRYVFYFLQSTRTYYYCNTTQSTTTATTGAKRATSLNKSRKHHHTTTRVRLQ